MAKGEGSCVDPALAPIGSGGSDGAVSVEVSDSGVGMDDETRAALFDVTLSERDGRMSAGFDLPAAQAIAQQHGGNIAVVSSVGKGTTFTVRLPIGANNAGLN